MQEDYGDLVKRILTVFNPGKFVMTLFASKVNPNLPTPSKSNQKKSV